MSRVVCIVLKTTFRYLLTAASQIATLEARCADLERKLAQKKEQSGQDEGPSLQAQLDARERHVVEVEQTLLRTQALVTKLQDECLVQVDCLMDRCLES